MNSHTVCRAGGHRPVAMRAGAWLAMLLGGVCLGCQQPVDMQFGGYIEAEQILVGSRVGGRIEEVFVDEGDEVAAGTLLVRFEREHLEAELAEAQHRVERLSATLDKLIAGPRPQEIEAARQQWNAAVARMQNAQSIYKRRLETGDFTPREEIDKAETDVKVAAADEEARRQELILLEEGTRAEDIVIARRALEEAQAHVVVLQQQLREAEVAAPADALVEVFDMQPGDLVAAGAPLATLVRKDELWVRCFVPSTQITFIRAGQSVGIRVDSRPDVLYRGVVERVNRVAEFTPRNVQTYEQRADQVFGVKVRVDNPEEQLRPGMAATVVVPRDASQSAAAAASP